MSNFIFLYDACIAVTNLILKLCIINLFYLSLGLNQSKLLSQLQVLKGSDNKGTHLFTTAYFFIKKTVQKTTTKT